MSDSDVRDQSPFKTDALGQHLFGLLEYECDVGGVPENGAGGVRGRSSNRDRIGFGGGQQSIGRADAVSAACRKEQSEAQDCEAAVASGAKCKHRNGEDQECPVNWRWEFFQVAEPGVAMVRVKVLVVGPGGRVGGLKEAVARSGSPVAARVIGLDIAACNWTEKV